MTQLAEFPAKGTPSLAWIPDFSEGNNKVPQAWLGLPTGGTPSLAWIPQSCETTPRTPSLAWIPQSFETTLRYPTPGLDHIHTGPLAWLGSLNLARLLSRYPKFGLDYRSTGPHALPGLLVFRDKGQPSRVWPTCVQGPKLCLDSWPM